MADETPAILVKIMRYEVKGGKGEPLERAELAGGFGILGDYNAGNGKRQVSLLSQKAREYMEAHKDKGLCFERFKENLAYSGDLPEAAAEGAALSVGDAVLRVTAGKRCFSECALFKRGEPCPLSSDGRFAIVIKGGAIRLGDRIAKNEG